MCGRTACTLSPTNIQRACAYRDEKGNLKNPGWTDAPCGGLYKPSANIPPTAYTPILYQPKSEEDRVLQPMMWGVVPPWFKGTNPKAHGLSTNNARLEGLQDSKLYRGCLTRRCLVVCDGFYEWKRDGAVKQPYLVHASQKDNKIENVLKYSEDPDSEINQGVWSGPQLLEMAGLYSVWKGEDGLPVYNYTVLTTQSNQVFTWLHSRVPCFVLEKNKDKWLDPTTPIKQALDLLEPVHEGDLGWHPVSGEVGNVKHQELDLIRPATPLNENKKVVSKASVNLMTNWLKKRPLEDSSKDTQNKKKM